VVGYLGPDLLGPDWDAVEAVARLTSEPETPAFVALIDQRNLAGLGNVYVNELLFLRGMLPTRPIGDDPDATATVNRGRRMIDSNRMRPEIVTTGDLRQGHQTFVYGRAGRPCRRCGTPIRRGKLGATALVEREIFWCPRCQS